jgi:hypothetical protein
MPSLLEEEVYQLKRDIKSLLGWYCDGLGYTYDHIKHLQLPLYEGSHEGFSDTAVYGH